MPARTHRGPLPPADEPLRRLAAELRRHVVHLAETIGERNLQRRPAQLAQAADYIEADLTTQRLRGEATGVRGQRLPLLQSGSRNPWHDAARRNRCRRGPLRFGAGLAGGERQCQRRGRGAQPGTRVFTSDDRPDAAFSGFRERRGPVCPHGTDGFLGVRASLPRAGRAGDSDAEPGNDRVFQRSSRQPELSARGGTGVSVRGQFHRLRGEHPLSAGWFGKSWQPSAAASHFPRKAVRCRKSCPASGDPTTGRSGRRAIRH